MTEKPEDSLMNVLDELLAAGKRDEIMQKLGLK